MKTHPLLLLLACSIAGAGEPDRPAGTPLALPLMVAAPTCYFMRTIRPVDPPTYSSGFIPLQYHPAETTQSTCTTGSPTLRAQRPAPSAADGRSHPAANLRKPRRS